MPDLPAHDDAAEGAEVWLLGAGALIAQSNYVFIIGHVEIDLLHPHISLSRTALTAPPPPGKEFACAIVILVIESDFQFEYLQYFNSNRDIATAYFLNDISLGDRYLHKKLR